MLRISKVYTILVSTNTEKHRKMTTLITINYGQYTENTELNKDNLLDVISHIEENKLDWSYVVKGDFLMPPYVSTTEPVKVTPKKSVTRKSNIVTKLEDANDIGYKEYKDYYRVGEGSIAIDKNEVTREYCVFDARNGHSTDYADTLTEARKLLREYLNTEKVLIMSEKRFYNTDFKQRDI